MRPGPILRAVVLVCVVGLGLTALAEAQGDESDVRRGQHVVAQNCAACHAIAETGESPNPAAPAFRTLSERYPLENLEEALGEGITVGHEGVTQMPEFAFSPEDVGDIIAYLRTIQTAR